MATPLERMEHTGDAPATGLSGNINSSATSFNVLSGAGYPTGAVGPFVICLDPGTPSEEKILCLSRSGSAFTVVTSPSSGRGWDGTTATSHNAGTVNVTHTYSAAEADDANSHVYDTTRDDHTEYARTDGTRAITGPQTIQGELTVTTGGASVTGNLDVVSGGLTVTAGGLSVVAGGAMIVGTTAVTGTATATGAIGAALTGTAGRYVGSTSGAPASGTFNTGDFADDPTNGCLWICTAGGTSGTWHQVGGLTDAAWTNVASFSNSWASQGGSNPAVGYRKVDGRVYLRGVLISGTVSTTAFVLPSGYIPSAAQGWVCADNVGTSFAKVVVDASGNVSTNLAGCDLANVSFDTL